MKILFLSLAFSALALITWSQHAENITQALESTPNHLVKCDLLQFNKETQNGYTVKIHSDVSTAEKQWKQFMETTYAAEVKKSKGAWQSENVKASDICPEPLTISAFFSEDEDGCKMKVFYKRGDAYLFDKENPKETLGINSQIRSFLKKTYVVTYESVLEVQRKDHEHETKSLEKLEKEGEKIEKDITKEDEAIKKAEEDIINAELEISEIQAKIQELQAKIENSNALKVQLEEDKTKKTEEIVNQKRVVDKSSTRIEKLKSSAEKLN